MIAYVLACLLCVAAFLYLRRSRTKVQQPRKDDTPRNPLSEEFYPLLDQRRPIDIYKEALDKDRLKQLLDFNDDFGDFDPLNNESLNRFNTIKRTTACIYAKRAKVWGTPWDDNLSSRENFKNCVPVLARFVKTVKLKKFTDAIIIEARGAKYCDSVTAVSQTFRELSQVLSENDPCKSKFMDTTPDKSPYWSFTFGDEAFFITTFAYCYPSTHPRHSYGLDSLFVLMQPEISFAVHEIPIRGTPGTPRWKIREAFKEIGQPYEHNEPRHMPVAWWFVRPIDINTENLMRGHVTEDDENGEPVERGYDVIPWWQPQA